MKNVYPYITNDGSVGLYSPEFDDIYHSTFGAYAEACEKFVIPSDLDFYIENFLELNVLDICYGIGYNTKSFLNFYIKKYCGQNKCNETIYSNNISTKNGECKKSKVYINAIDNDKFLVYLSPFFACNAKRKPRNQNLPTEKVKKLSEDVIKQLYDYENFINLILIDKLSLSCSDFLQDGLIKNFITNQSQNIFLEKNSVFYYKKTQNNRIQTSFLGTLSALLHNIYYQNVSTSYKKALNALKNVDLSIDYNIDDARKVVLADNNHYHLVFLDAFTPTKCPCLWSLDFFKLLYERLDDNGRILTYSNSAQIRNAFINTGFYVGKIYNQRTKTYTGTIAVKNPDFIKHQLSEYDLSLMKTRAGIFYRDENLSALNESIVERHKKDVENSPLISSSKFIKQYRKEHQNV